MWAKVKRLEGLGGKVKERVWMEEDHGGEGYGGDEESKGKGEREGKGKGVAVYKLMRRM